MVSFWFGSLYKYQGYLDVDLKYKVVKNFGRNQVLVNPQIAYEDIIDNFLLGLEKKNIVTQEMREVLQSLKDSSNNFDAHITVWADNLHLFPKRWKPPLLLDKTFRDAHFSQKFLIKLNEAKHF